MEENNQIVNPPTAPLIGSFCDLADLAIDQDENHSDGIFSDLDCDVCNDGLGGQLFIADNFIASKSGNITSICFAGAYFPGNLVLAVDDFTVTYYADAAGLPGAVIAGPMSLTVDSREMTGVVLFGVDEYGYQGSHGPVAVASGQTYWVEVVNNTAGNTDSWFWESGDQDPVNGIFDGVASFDEVDWLPIGAFDLAFALGYEVQAPIPTMGEWGIFILGLSFLVIGIVAVRLRTRKVTH
jgi:hypothetical protein